MPDIVDLSSHYIGSPGGGVNLYQVPNASMAVLANIINATWNEAKGSKAEFSAKIASAITTHLSAGSTPTISTGSVAAPTIEEPFVSIPDTISVNDAISTFDTKTLEIMASLVEKFESFRDTYFPDESEAYLAAESWLKNAIENPDAAMPDAVADKIWESDRSRIVGDASRAADSVMAQFASRRFPVPPGAALSAVVQISQKAQGEIAESSRKVAMLSVELQRFNVEKLLGLRGMAMDSAIKYISAIASSHDSSSKVVGLGYDAQSKLISSAASFYNARTQAAETVSKVSQYNNSIALEAAGKNQAASLNMIDSRVKALLSEAQAISQMTTSLFNNLHASVSLSATGGAQLSQSGEF